MATQNLCAYVHSSMTDNGQKWGQPKCLRMEELINTWSSHTQECPRL